MNKPLLFIFAVFCAMWSDVAVCKDKAKITIKVVDEEGKPLTGITVGATFLYGTKEEGLADANGKVALEGEAGGWDTWYSVREKGFYNTFGKYMLSNSVGGKWQPWNPTVTAVVKRIMNPIPMYAKQVDTVIPATNTACGYDLMIGDWVSPYGKGEKADFTFTLTGFNLAPKNNEAHLKLVLSNCVDGIHRAAEEHGGSDFALSRYAPTNSYETVWANDIGNLPGKGYFDTQGGTSAGINDKTWGYFFRIRSATNEVGKITGVYYGKIRSAIRFFGCSSRILRFTYYLNPTPNDRNLEFDPKRNLLKNLKSTEEVTYP